MEAALSTYQRVQRQTQRDELVLDHLDFVRHILGRLLIRLPDRVDSENLESAGVVGLIEAAGQYDPARGVPFRTYAYPRIRGAILDELRRNCPLPQQMLERWGVIRDAYAQLTHDATPENLAELSGLSISDVTDCLQAMQLTRPDSWLDELTDEVPDRNDSLSVEDQIDREDHIRILADLIEALPEQMRLVVTLYYSEGLRLREIGEVLELSESRVSRILSEAELQLRSAAHRRGC